VKVNVEILYAPLVVDLAVDGTSLLILCDEHIYFLRNDSYVLQI